MTPDFSVMKDDMFLAAGKLGNGRYDKIIKKSSFSEADIEDAMRKIRDFKGTVNVNVTSARATDFVNCWKAMGINPTLGDKINDNLKLTWHHIDDLDVNGKSTFQLVHYEVHKKTTNHLGSHFQIEQLLTLIEKYDTI